MTRDPFGQSIQRVDRDAQFALNELKRHPDYPAIQLRALEESESLFKSVGSQLPNPALPSPERLDCAIKSMDIWAGAYTGLIANLPDQEKYLKVLGGLRLHAWRLYIGMTGIEPLPYNQAWVAIRDRSAHWQKESLRKLVPPQAPLSDQTVSEPQDAPALTHDGEVLAEMKSERSPESKSMESQPKAAPDSFIESDAFPLKDYARERLATTIADAEKKLLESDPSRHGLLEYRKCPLTLTEHYAREALSPGKLEERKQQQAGEREENVIQYFRAVFAGYLEAHLDSRRDYSGMRGLLPTVYGELLDRTFFQKWLQDPWADRDSEYTRFSDAVEEQLSKSEEWAGFIKALDLMARKAGNPQPPGDLAFTELVHSAAQPLEFSEQAPPSSATSARQGKGLDDFASEAARTSALADYIERWTCSEAALARTATVDPADLSKWKKGSLPVGSEKMARIENALRNNEPATPAANRPKNS